jgi:hypothetical protein
VRTNVCAHCFVAQHNVRDPGAGDGLFEADTIKAVPSAMDSLRKIAFEGAASVESHRYDGLPALHPDRGVQ